MIVEYDVTGNPEQPLKLAKTKYIPARIPWSDNY
eukprot:CAMPEP_0115011808 /NCGR_PEP_ID=MMETSP0216-20121206/24302_1 /TAXON_ID=223996 /ORGANISM="Protocruzia adherens, Strain Boccale" /LENGTH=33 /DNA_ID= /DNA_START= /DNA_END= /DNA_ORIENTATION=